MTPPFEMLGPLAHTPFVSAFALTYNHEDYIAEAIESGLAENWPAGRFEFGLGLRELPGPRLTAFEDAAALRERVERRWRFPVRA